MKHLKEFERFSMGDTKERALKRVTLALENDEISYINVDRGTVKFGFDGTDVVFTAIDNGYKLEITKGYKFDFDLTKEEGKKIYDLAISKHDDIPF
jgi:hypothetical protein